MYFFEDVEKDKKLGRILEEWLGTPFRHRCHIKQKGTDCIGLAIGVFKEMEVLKVDFKPIEYNPDWHIHNGKELLLEGVKKVLDVEEVENLEDVRNGDVCLYRFGKAAAHAGIYYNGYLYQALNIGRYGRVEKIPWAKCMKINSRIAPMTFILRLRG